MKKLEVRLTWGPDDERTVGTLAHSDRRIYFEWDRDYLDEGQELAPFKLPREPGLHEHRDRGFGPLPGLFADSLPDGWGMLLMDRHFRRQGLAPVAVSPLDRLAYLGKRTMGALTYHPATGPEADTSVIDLFELGQHAQEVFAGSAEEILPQLLTAGGSPGGARPKVLVGVRGDELLSGADDLPEGFEHWIVKFAARDDAASAGPVEYAYSRMAAVAGVQMPPTRLFEVKKGRRTQRWFAVRRFDRGPGSRRFHVQSLASLIHADFRIPAQDYGDLLEVTRALTRNHADVLRAFRQMAFNVAAHVRDDHTKNFAFVLDAHAEWALTPAYDLTFAEGPGGEHTMSVAGEGKSPDRRHCLEVAKNAGIRPREAEAAIARVNDAVGRWSEFAEAASCPRAAKQAVRRRLRQL